MIWLDEYFRYYSLPNFDLGKIEEKILGSEIESNKYLFEGEAILVSKLNPRKPRVWHTSSKFKERKICSTEFVVLNNPVKNCDPTFYSYFISSDITRPTLESLASGSTNSHTRFNPTDFKRLKLLTPPLNEQTKIAEIITSVDDVIELTEKEIEKLQMLKKGMMQDLLTKGIGQTKFKDSPVGQIPEGWEVLELGQVTKRCAFGPRFPSTEYDPSGNFRLFRTTDISKSWEIIYETMPIARLESAEFENHVLKDKDLLITRSGTIGVTTVFNTQFSDRTTIPGAFLINFRLDNRLVVPEFVRYFLMSNIGQSQVQSMAAGGVQQNLSGSSLKRVQIVKPSLEEQNRITGVLDTVALKIREAIKSREKLIKLKKALMSDLLTGKVRVQV
jgi:type I restriction enzyme S subunit